MSGTQEVGEIFGAGSGPAHAMLRSPTVLIAAIGLWGMNVYLFRAFGIDYVKVLKQDLLKLETANNNSMNNNSQHGGGGGTGANNSTTTTTGKQQQHRGGGSRTNALIIGAPMSRGGGIIHIARKDSSEYVDCENSFAASDTNSKSGINNNNLSMDIGEDDEFDIMESSNLLQQQVDDTTFANDSKITSSRLIGLSLTLLVVLHTTYTISISWLKTGPITAILAFYGAVTTAILLPFPSTRWLRVSAVLVFQRAYELVNPRCYYCCTLDTLTNVASTATAGATTSTTAAIINDENANGTQTSSNNKIPRPIPFIDVFFADAMCSLSKVFFDWGMLIHMAAYYPRPVSSSAWNILIPSAAAAVPYVIRARQCLVMWSVASSKNDPGRYQHLWNALKYCTSIFPLCLSAYQKTAPKERAPDFEIYLIILLFVNAAYALWWDVGECGYLE